MLTSNEFYSTGDTVERPAFMFCLAAIEKNSMHTSSLPIRVLHVSHESVS